MINFTGTNGLFYRIGAILDALKVINAFQGTGLAACNTYIASLYPSSSSEADLINNLFTAFTQAQTGAESYVSTFGQSLAQNTVNSMVFDDTPLASNNDIQASLVEVISQMIANSYSVSAMTVSGSASANSGNRGNGVMVVSTYRNDGLILQNIFTENVMVFCTADSTGSAVAGNETFTASGEVAETDYFASDWPLGSGGQTSLNAVSGADTATTGNLLTDGDFEDWSSGSLTDWTSTGTITQDTGTFYTGASSLEFTTGTPSVEQAVTVSSLTQYAFNCWVNAPTGTNAGVLTISLVDENGSVIDDQQGNANSFTKTLSGLSSATWTPVNGVFRLPQVLPTTVNLKIALTTGLQATKTLLLDTASLALGAQLYAGGPTLWVFSGNSAFYIPDGFVVAMSCTNGNFPNTFAAGFQRLFQMSTLQDQLGNSLQLPYSGSPNVSDGLIES